jgi:hypothetical protein
VRSQTQRFFDTDEREHFRRPDESSLFGPISETLREDEHCKDNQDYESMERIVMVY